jgi:hypothetical protein
MIRSVFHPQTRAFTSQVVERAKREDLNNVLKYSVSFIRNKRGEVITDRRFNTASLLEVYMGREAAGQDAVSWSPDDPNVLTMSLPGVREPGLYLVFCEGSRIARHVSETGPTKYATWCCLVRKLIMDTAPPGVLSVYEDIDVTEYNKMFCQSF